MYDGLKDAARILKEAGKIEQYKQILDNMEKLLEMQKRNQELEVENRELRDKLKIKESLVIRNHAYWNKDSNDGPFCTRCWDAESSQIRMHPNGNPAYFSCPNCKSGSVKARPELDDSERQFKRINHDQYR